MTQARLRSRTRPRDPRSRRRGHAVAAPCNELLQGRLEARRAIGRRSWSRWRLPRSRTLRARKPGSRPSNARSGATLARSSPRGSRFAGAIDSSRTASPSCSRARDVPRLRELPGVRDVFASASYVPQLDRSPQQIGAPALWGAGLETAGQGVKIGVIDTGVDPRPSVLRSDGLHDAGRVPQGSAALHEREGHRRASVSAARSAERERGARLRRRQLVARHARRRDRGRERAHAGERPHGVGHRAARVHRELQGARAERTRA